MFIEASFFTFSSCNYQFSCAAPGLLCHLVIIRKRSKFPKTHWMSCFVPKIFSLQWYQTQKILTRIWQQSIYSLYSLLLCIYRVIFGYQNCCRLIFKTRHLIVLEPGVQSTEGLRGSQTPKLTPMTLWKPQNWFWWISKQRQGNPDCQSHWLFPSHYSTVFYLFICRRHRNFSAELQ